MIGQGGAWFPPALHGDHLGRVTLTTGAHGKGVGEARHTPYGEMRQGDPRGAIPTDRRFTGQRWEASLGLYDYRARFYDPLLGRFLRPKPMGCATRDGLVSAYLNVHAIPETIGQNRAESLLN